MHRLINIIERDNKETVVTSWAGRNMKVLRFLIKRKGLYLIALTHVFGHVSSHIDIADDITTGSMPILVILVMPSLNHKLLYLQNPNEKL